MVRALSCLPALPSQPRRGFERIRSQALSSLWFTDPQGVGMAPASFTLPPGLAGVQGLMLHHAAVILDFATLASTFATEPSGLRLF